MNLNAVANGVAVAVTPNLSATIQISAGSTVNADRSRTPTYTTFTDVPVQVQALSFRDLQQVDGLNLQGIRRAIYINRRIDGLVRQDNKGGDLITLTDGPDAGVWLVAMVLEYWADWTKVACTLQNGS